MSHSISPFSRTDLPNPLLSLFLLSDTATYIQQQAGALLGSAQNKAGEAQKQGGDAAQQTKDAANSAAKDAKDIANSGAKEGQKNLSDLTEQARHLASDAINTAQSYVKVSTQSSREGRRKRGGETKKGSEVETFEEN